MFPSIVALLALPDAFAVENAAELQNEIQAACASTSATYTITLPDELVLEPDEVVVFPDPTIADCDLNPPDLIFEPNPGVIRAEVSLQPQVVTAVNTLFTFTNGVSATFRDIDMRGPFTGEPGTETIDGNGQAVFESEVYAAICALGGGRTRGVEMSTASSVRGTLTIEGGAFTCLNANGSGGAIFTRNSFVDIQDALFDSNSASSFGGAVYVTGTGVAFENESVGLKLDNVQFDSNSALLGGGVANDWEEMNTEITFSGFFRNFGSLGAGGVDLVDQRDVVMRYNEFDRQNPTNLDVEQQGGAVRVDSGGLYNASVPPTAAERGSLLFNNNILCGSLAGRGGGLFVNAVPDVDISNSVFSENVGLDLGGGLHLQNDVGSFQSDITVLHNTFVGNVAGRTPDFVTPTFIYTLGGGSAASFFGVNPEFRNNIVAFNEEPGGGVFVEYQPFTTNGFQIGDRFDYYNNLWYENDDGLGITHLTGDVANLSLHPSNQVDVDPELAYLNLGEYNCVPEAFYPLLSSPAVDGGGGEVVANVPGTCRDWADTDPIADFIPNAEVSGDTACDIGAFGGEQAMWLRDADLDGFVNIFDCDDDDPDRNPGAPEACDLQDNDCDGLVDEGFQSVWYPDDDQDGFGRAGSAAVLTCEIVAGHVASVDGTPINTDCDDASAISNPEAPEICDGLDNNCDGVEDDGLSQQLWYEDVDGDGFGDFQYPGEDCAPPTLSAIPQGGDCNDTNPNVNPDAAELCGNDVDDDCNNLVDAADPGAGANLFFVDNDGDGDGNINAEPTASCAPAAPDGFSARGGDCNDNQPEINSISAVELCNTLVDEDCDGVIDEADANSDARAFYADSDGDTFGNPADVVYSCEQVPGPGYVENTDDCNDADPLVGECTSGCSSTGTAAGGFFALMLSTLALFGRRRT